MANTRLKSSCSIDSNVNTKVITRNITCKDLFTMNDLQFACRNCLCEVDILSKSTPKSSRNNVKHRTKKCDQAWNESYATTSARALFHLQICERLKVQTNVTLEEEFVCTKSTTA